VPSVAFTAPPVPVLGAPAPPAVVELVAFPLEVVAPPPKPVAVTVMPDALVLIELPVPEVVSTEAALVPSR